MTFSGVRRLNGVIAVALFALAAAHAAAGETAQQTSIVRAPVSTDEARFLADQTCLDESECYGPKRFQRYIFKRYPDISKITYKALPADANDADTLAMRKEQFYQGLYFAKQIRLANGQSLFDFMRSCSRGFTALDAADVAFDDKAKASYFALQYFPTLRRVDSGEPVELQILLERRGDKLIPGSSFFTSNALRYSDFLKRHNVTCWNAAE
ncbi:hypothetical protein [Burkholderia vietnamiensis]|uniref:hypothetical protein n=1 Tax=Burkholderia vietnamiensis TaxID=60552 RepID=UPI001CF4373A|nr:hypothetical protein [Burkholderia vietnamiensis]MCA8198873.1 hypothetical protein [Burkholderia vietnamiensis]